MAFLIWPAESTIRSVALDKSKARLEQLERGSGSEREATVNLSQVRPPTQLRHPYVSAALRCTSQIATRAAVGASRPGYGRACQFFSFVLRAPVITADRLRILAL